MKAQGLGFSAVHGLLIQVSKGRQVSPRERWIGGLTWKSSVLMWNESIKVSFHKDRPRKQGKVQYNL